LRYDASDRGESEHAEEFLRGLAARRALGEPRESTNRLYYQWWKGRAVHEIQGKAKRWWQERFVVPSDALRTDVLARYEWHRERGHDRVLLSGSFRDLIDPLAQKLEATRVIATEPETHGGIYTGEILEPMIGQAKQRALQEDALSNQINLDASYGYGDHPSDLPFLSLLGNPHLVTSPSSLSASGI
jgi:HAD superfamily hydrolase (TIGR01490 family)